MRLSRIRSYAARCLLLAPLACAPAEEPAPAPPPPDTRPAVARQDTIPAALPQVPPLPGQWRALRCPPRDPQPRRFTAREGQVGLDIARMTIPTGALDREVPFTFTPSNTAIEVGIDMDSDTLAFGRAVELTMSYAHCPPGLPNPGRPLAIWRYRQRDGWQNLGGKSDEQARTITVSITELSRFAIGTH